MYLRSLRAKRRPTSPVPISESTLVAQISSAQRLFRCTCICLAVLSGAGPSFAQAFWNPVATGLMVDLPLARADALAREQADAMPRTAFYMAAPGPPGKIGELIRHEVGLGYNVPAGVSATRILYWSMNPSGSPIAASGVVLIPSGIAPAEGWPIIAWAHGTSGAAHQCAPSLEKDLQYGWIELSNLLGAGYAVVAADYQGLGAPGLHPYLDPQSNAGDVIAAIPAAQAAVPSLGRRWVALGHSQGALATSAIAELESKRPDPGYLGAIAVAGGWDAEELLGYWGSPNSDPMLRGFLSLLTTGIPPIETDFRADDLLMPEAIARISGIEAHCDSVHVGALYDLGHSRLLRPGWAEAPAIMGWLNRVRLSGASRLPLLVIASTDDPIVPARLVDSAVRTLCANGGVVEYLRLDGTGLDHTGVLTATTTLRLRWIQDRFAQKKAVRSCHWPARGA